MSGNYDRALDLTQDVFVNALRGWRSVRDPSRIRAWLFRIARNVALRNTHEERRLPTESLEGRDPSLGSTGVDPEEQILQQERERLIEEALRSLPTEMRLAVLLRDKEGLEYREMAQVLGCSEGTVASRLNRARRLLGKKIARMR